LPDADEEDVPPVPPVAEAEADADDEPVVPELGDGWSSEPPPLHAVRTSAPTSPAAASPARRRGTVRERIAVVTGGSKL
jgi:hypothetical protein